MNEQKLLKIYDELPDINCTGECWTSCGPLQIGEVEKRHIRAEHGDNKIPRVAHALTCNQLTDDKRCAIHKARPLLCRLYGLTKGLRCQYGCEPEFWVSERKARKLMDRVIRNETKTGFKKYLNDGADSN